MLFVGLDLGTTSAKAVVYDDTGATVGSGRAATVWRTTSNGVETAAGHLRDIGIHALRSAVAEARRTRSDAVAAVGITSMGESGVLVDAQGEPVAPVVAWHDARDAAEVAELTDVLGADEFGRVAGKPLRGQWSLTKHLWLRRHHEPTSTARRRFNVAEWLVRSLGGDEVTELSLACRTGWFDVAAGTWWTAALDFSHAAESLFPPLVAAGEPVGHISADFGPDLAGALLTVVGHDHQAAAHGAGAGHPGVEFDSCGTAEALIRTVAPIGPEQVLALARHGVTTDRSVQPGQWSLLGGTEGGLAMQRVLGLLGVDRDGLAGLDDAAATAPTGRVRVRGLGTASLSVDGVLDDTGPGELWRAAVQAATDDAAALHRAMDDVVGPVREVVAGGGWTNSTTFMTAKDAALPHLRRSEVAEAGTRGAAEFAARAAGALAADETFPGAAAVPA